MPKKIIRLKITSGLGIEGIPKPKLKTVYAKDQKGAISCVAHISGYLLVCMGPKVRHYNEIEFAEMSEEWKLLFTKKSIELYRSEIISAFFFAAVPQLHFYMRLCRTKTYLHGSATTAFVHA